MRTRIFYSLIPTCLRQQVGGEQARLAIRVVVVGGPVALPFHVNAGGRRTNRLTTACVRASISTRLERGPSLYTTARVAGCMECEWPRKNVQREAAAAGRGRG